MVQFDSKMFKRQPKTENAEDDLDSLLGLVEGEPSEIEEEGEISEDDKILSYIDFLENAGFKVEKIEQEDDEEDLEEV